MNIFKKNTATRLLEQFSDLGLPGNPFNNPSSRPKFSQNVSVMFINSPKIERCVQSGWPHGITGHHPPRGSPRKFASQRALRGSLRGLCGGLSEAAGLCGALRGSAGFSEGFRG